MQIIDKDNTIALLPGWGFKASIWHEFIKPYQYFNKITYIDLPVNSLCLDHILDQLSLQILPGSTIAAWSLGGLLAIALCHRYPGRYKKLILASSTPKFVSAYNENWPGISSEKALKFYRKSEINMADLLQNFLRLVEYPLHKALLRNIIKKHLIYADSIFLCDHLKYYLGLLIQSDFREYYHQLSLPIYHIFGELDAIVPVLTSEKLLISNSIIRVIPKAGHISFLTHHKIFKKYFDEALYEKYS